MELKISDVIQLIQACYQNRVATFTVDGLSMTFQIESKKEDAKLTTNGSYSTFSPPSQENTKQNNTPVIDSKELEALLKPLNPFEGLSEEEILYASTPYFDELQAKKELHQKKLDEELKA